MSTAAGPVSEETVELFMDYGQFCIDGGLGDPDEETDLLDRALAAHPFASNGLAMVVLSPHQNNFRMPVTVQVWGARPPSDRDEWQQVCESRLRVGPEGTLYLSSPVDGAADCPVPEGGYLIEVSGRGFVNYGWPGSTEPGDVWRIRLWPSGGSEPLRAVQWNMPGYGVPEDVPIPERSVSAESEEPEWVMVIDENGPRHLHISEFREQAVAAERQRWAQIRYLNCGIVPAPRNCPATTAPSPRRSPRWASRICGVWRAGRRHRPAKKPRLPKDLGYKPL